MEREPGHRGPDSAAQDRLRDGLREAGEAIRGAQRVLVASHAHPDGDAIAASLALAHLLRRMGKTVTVFNVHPVPYNFRFLPGADLIRGELDEDSEFDLTCVLDCSKSDQLGDAFPKQGWAERVLAIDHHQMLFEGATHHLRDPDAAAVGELIYRLASELDIAIDQEMAECIYCSLMADTGCFRYSSTSSTALRVAAEMVEAGVDVWRMTSQVYENNPIARTELLAKVLRTLWISACGRLAAVRITRRMLREVKADDAMIDGFINHARSIQGVEVAVQLREMRAHRYYVSFRTRGSVNVGRIAERFGGGGTRHAAGCEMHGRWRDILQALTQCLDELCPSTDDDTSRSDGRSGHARSMC